VNELDRHLDAGLDAVAGIDLRLVAVALAFQLANLVLRSLAWRNVVRAAYPDHRVPLLGLGSAYAAGVAANALTPARGGELVKIGLARTLLPGTAVTTLIGTGAVLLLFDGALGAALLGLSAATGAVPGLDLLPPPPSPWLLGLGLVCAAPVAGFLFVRARPLVGRVRRQVLHGGAILRQPRRYLHEVALVQLGAWTCRIGVVYALLAAFDLRASVPLAALVVVAGGLSTVVPATPGGIGTQQLLLVGVLHGTATAGEALSFSLALQGGATLVNLALGLAGAMLLVGTRSPRAAVRALADRDVGSSPRAPRGPR
jgi:uncharacterized membrane protein YbhN (UPF0104 family)